MYTNVCRICLDDKSRLVLSSHDVKDTWENLTGIELGKPLMACYLCHAHLRRCDQLRKRALKSEALLMKMIRTGGKVTQESMRFIDRRRYNLHYNYSTSITDAWKSQSSQNNFSDDIDAMLEIKLERLIDAGTLDNLQNSEVSEHAICYRKIVSPDTEGNVSEEKYRVPPEYSPMKNETHTSSELFDELKEELLTPSPENIIAPNTSFIQSIQSIKSIQQNSINGDVKHNTVKSCNALTKDETLASSSYWNPKVLLYKLKVFQCKVCSKVTNCKICIKCGSDSREEPPETVFTKSSEQKKNKSSYYVRKRMRQQIGTIKTNIKEKLFVCKFCNCGYVKQKSLNNHVASKHGKICNERYNKKSVVDKHRKSSNMREKKISCANCEYRCYQKYEIIRHMQKHTKEMCCDPCKSSFPLKCHKHSQEKKYSCEICKYQCHRKSTLIEHIRKHTGETPYSCNICKSRFRRKQYLISHMYKHTGEKPFICYICNAGFVQSSSLYKHLKSKHAQEMKYKLYSCKLCVYQCKDKHVLSEHMRKHKGERPYSCDICDSRFSRKSSLVEHMRKHTGEKLIKCYFCNTTVTTKYNLNKHIKSKHIREKKYSCEICIYQCYGKYDMTRHMQMHTGEKPYSCDVCEYRCRNRNHLNTHMLRHSGNKPFNCEICEYKCYVKSELMKHIRKHMGELTF